MQVQVSLTQPPTYADPRDPGEQHKQLLADVANNADRDAFRVLFVYFGPRVKALMIKSGAIDSEAEDIAQEVMIKVWQKGGMYSPARGAVSTWIYTIARNARIDRLRRSSSRAYEDIDELELACDNDNAEDEVMAGQQAQQVSQALALLPAEQKTIMELAFLHDLPQATIADRLGLPLGTVKSRMRLAYEKLRVNLENVK